MSTRHLAVLLVVGVGRAFGDVFSYECTSFPEDAGWDVVQIVCDPELWVDDGWFFQHVKLCPGYPPPGGKEATYRRSVGEYLGVETFFVQWRVETDGDRSEIPWGGPSGLAAGSGWAGVRYTFFVARDQVKLNRDNSLPIVFVDVEPETPHTYRLEHFGDVLYVWYIDGEVVDSGVPEGPYPIGEPRITWWARSAFLEHTTKWGHIRFGVIPLDGSGDYDSDEDLDLRDWYFFEECLGNGGPGIEAWPGCRFADMDQDGDVDFHDFRLFQAAFTGNGE